MSLSVQVGETRTLSTNVFENKVGRARPQSESASAAREKARAVGMSDRRRSWV